MFRVMGKRRPRTVVPYLPTLQELSENDPNPISAFTVLVLSG